MYQAGARRLHALGAHRPAESVVASLVTIALLSVVYTQLFLAFYPEANAGL